MRVVWFLRQRQSSSPAIATPLKLQHFLRTSHSLRHCANPSLVFARCSASSSPSDSSTVRFALKAFTDAKAAQRIHGQAVRAGLVSDAGFVAAVVRAYSFCGLVCDARKVFDETRSPDMALGSEMVGGYVKVGDVENAWKVFESLPDKGLIAWTSVIAGFAQAKRPAEAVAVFRRMQVENIELDEVAMLAVLSACAHLGSLELGERLHSYVLKRGFCGMLRLNNALVDMYAKSGSITRAVDVFEGVQEKNVVTWTTMISGLALHGLGREAGEMFSRMEGASVKPNGVTFVALLSACSHAGLVEMGRWFFNNMASRYGVRPRIEHYGCMVDLLGRAGFLKEARELVAAMPFEANAAIWGSLLAASNIHGNAELGRVALQHLLVLEPRNSGNYMLLTNIYSKFGEWGDSGSLRKIMRDWGVKKNPGGSLIEVNNTVHQFVAGDMSYSEFGRAFRIVNQLFLQLNIDVHFQEDIIELLTFHE